MAREVEIPEGGDIGYSGLVTKTVVKRPIGALRSHRGEHPLAYPSQPCGIGRAGIAHKSGFVSRICPVCLLGLKKAPVLGMIGRPAVVSRIKIRGDVLDVPSKIAREQRGDLLRHVIRGLLAAVGEHRSSGNSERSQGDILFLSALLPHDYLVIPPRPLDWLGNE